MTNELKLFLGRPRHIYVQYKFRRKKKRFIYLCAMQQEIPPVKNVLARSYLFTNCFSAHFHNSIALPFQNYPLFLLFNCIFRNIIMLINSHMLTRACTWAAYFLRTINICVEWWRPHTSIYTCVTRSLLFYRNTRSFVMVNFRSAVAII